MIQANASPKSSNKWLITLLLITVMLTVWMALRTNPTNDEANELEVKHNDLPRKIQPLMTGELNIAINQNNLIPWQELKREPLTDKANNLFKIHSWLVIPPVKKIKPLPPPPPVAPQAPFTYFGKLEDSPKGTLIFLMASDKLYSVVKGENINQQWRLDNEEENILRLTYLPLNLPQVVSKLTRTLAAPALADMNQ